MTALGTYLYDDGEGDGLIAFCDAPAYEGYVGDWSLEDLVRLFEARAREGVLALQVVDQEETALDITFVDAPVAPQARREARLPIRITSGALWATTYTGLTEVADEPDRRLTDAFGTAPVLPLPNGDYTLTFRWLELDQDTQLSNVECVVRPGWTEPTEHVPGLDRLFG